MNSFNITGKKIALKRNSYPMPCLVILVICLGLVAFEAPASQEFPVPYPPHYLNHHSHPGTPHYLNHHSPPSSPHYLNHHSQARGLHTTSTITHRPGSSTLPQPSLT
ncbi:MAG: hypothetical protein L0922_03540, partial [Candidatus Mariimomonas ferrooxydans]